MDTPESTYEQMISNHKSLEIVPVPTQSAPRPFEVGDRVRLISAPDVEGVVIERGLMPSFFLVRWDGRISVSDTHVRSIELAPAPTPLASKRRMITLGGHEHAESDFCGGLGCKPTAPTPPEPKPVEPSLQEAEIAMGMVPYHEWSACLNIASIDASNSFKVKSMIDYAREIPATAPFASLIFDLANFLEDATKDNPCTGGFCTFDPRESCELCGKGQDEHAPRSWDGDRAKIRCGDHIYIGVEQPRLVVAATKDGIYYVDSRGVTVCLRDHQEIMRVERVGRNGWEEAN